ncbi:SapC family protein [Fulvimarina sp. 2208YS6-2-32]|uniref:SapC family protein n=1 Tax=Fulvimarina uroteuthidis TaxID=3098149 RepID=A0ABU5I0F7_9HYPH|nr:SapC family protein [Fulvimarina sp. 2208YS6-2-32]MDY8108868.1 SapC family protein [Fulvimarina sp. 2208YS6-2-32]
MSQTPSVTAAPEQAIQPLTPERHGERGWTRFSSYAFAAGRALAPLAAPEVSRAALELPLGFVAHEKGWQLVAVLGLAPGQNLFVGPDGRWHGGYVPAALRSHPFYIGRAESSDQMILCIDETSGLLAQEDGEPFFDGAGQLTQPMADVWTFMQEVARGEAQLNAACARLAENDIIEPWLISLKDGENERKVEGLHRVSEDKLNALDDETFGTLRRAGIVALAYAQMLSAGHIPKLGELARAHARHAEEAERRRQSAASAAPQETGHSFAPSESLDIDWSKIG